MAKKKGKSVTIDFTGVEAGGGSVLFPEGPQLFEVAEITEEEGSDSGQPYLAFVLKAVDGKYEGKKAYDNFSLQPQALWKLRGFMEASGIEVEDGEMDLDLDEMIGKIVMADVIHEEYKGKPKTRINGYSPAEDTDTDSTPVTKAKAKREEAEEEAPRRKKPAPAEEDDEPAFKVKQKVSFKDGKTKMEGTVTAIDGETYTVRVGRDEYEMGADDLTAA